ncbi:glycosyltransferase [Candidatus Gottesmanbacteria bacterium]|nr:glycosyltransferase [Candidatus Gottesmanbacteria bacterium]
MKVALVHDYLREYGGAERVLEAIHEMWPEAPLYTSFVDWPSFAKAPAGKVELFKSWDIRTSWVQKYWFIKKFISPLRFLAPWIWASFDLSDYDVVISSSGWFMCRGVALSRVKGVSPEVANENLDPSSEDSLRSASYSRSLKIEAGQNFVRSPTTLKAHRVDPLHICYIHHPPRNLYGYATGSDLQKYWIVRVYATIVNFFLRHYDFETAQKVDYFIANSEETARRVKKFYRRDSTVIYPPIEILQGVTLQRGQQGHPLRKREYFLSVGRLTYSKRVDLAIEACNTLKLPLKVVGSGKEEAYLRSLAGPTIEFVGSVTDEELGILYAGAKALIFCALDEDFGMVPVEAMAHGTPVIALAQGGVVETVVDPSASSGQATGVLFDEPTVESLVNALGRLGRLGKLGESCKKQAKKFGKERFKKELRDFVENHAAG